MPAVSIVVPVYNVARYLPQCLNSIREQPFEDFEVICVNDGSTDDSGELLERYARVDSRFRVITTPNHGVSHARNVGLDAARGEYLCFVDADDRVSPLHCETIVRLFRNEKVDIVKFSADPFPVPFPNEWMSYTLHLPDRVFRSYSDALMFDEPCRPFPWNGAYRSSFIKNAGVHFPEGLPLGEDQVFSFATVSRASGVMFSSARLYRYRVSRKDSAMAMLAENYTARIGHHLSAASAILDEWELQGRMEGDSAMKMARFVSDFIVPDLFEIKMTSDLRSLCDRYRAILLRYFSEFGSFSELSGCPSGIWSQAIIEGDDSCALFSRRSFYSYAAAQYGRRAALGCVRADIASSVRAFFGIPHGKKDASLDDAYANDDAFCVRECMKFEGEYARIMAEDTLK